MPRIISFREAVNEALLQEMERDQSVIAMGEDVIGCLGGAIWIHQRPVWKIW